MDIMKLMKQAQNLKKMQGELAKCTIDDEVDGVKLTLSGSSEVKKFEITQELYNSGKEAVEKATARVINSSLKKLMDLYKKKAKDAMGGIDLSGMMG